jgi:dolichol-phosphate mannosyltransferase
LIVDDQSTDGTQLYITQLPDFDTRVFLQARSLREGIGAAHISGIKFSFSNGYDLCVTMDGDGSHSPKFLSSFIELLNRNERAGVVIGSRFIKGGGTENWSLLRSAMTRLGHLLTFIFLGTRIDSSSGFRGYKISSDLMARLMLVKHLDYRFFPEITLLLIKSRTPIFQVPIMLPRRTYGSSKMKLTYVIRLVFFIVTSKIHYTFNTKPRMREWGDNG